MSLTLTLTNFHSYHLLSYVQKNVIEFLSAKFAFKRSLVIFVVVFYMVITPHNGQSTNYTIIILNIISIII